MKNDIKRLGMKQEFANWIKSIKLLEEKGTLVFLYPNEDDALKAKEVVERLNRDINFSIHKEYFDSGYLYGLYSQKKGI